MASEQLARMADSEAWGKRDVNSDLVMALFGFRRLKRERPAGFALRAFVGVHAATAPRAAKLIFLGVVGFNLSGSPTARTNDFVDVSHDLAFMAASIAAERSA